MNAESTAADALDVSLPARKWRFPQLARLARLFGFGPPPSPQRPAVRHPFDRLVFHNLAIYEMYRGQPGRKYMSLSSVEVVRKISLRELDWGQCEYRFELSATPDPVWQCYFKALLPEGPVRIENKTLVLICLAGDLESSYEQIKSAMSWANFWHTEERETLLAKITSRDEAERSAREMEENRRLGLQRQFEHLDI